MHKKIILITGCSGGIGYCAAKILKKRGYRVLTTARKLSDINRLKAEGFESFQLDLDNSSSLIACVNNVLEQTHGRLDALFNNSGYLQIGAIEDLTRDIIRAQFETNTFGPMELTQLVLPVFRKQGYGRIIQNSSILGLMTYPYRGAYNASKFALEGFSLTLRQELKGTQIFISLINSGPVQSHLRENARQKYEVTLNRDQEKRNNPIYEKLHRSYFNLDKKNSRLLCKPELVVKKLIHALESKAPKPHYYVGFPAQLSVFLKTILPDRIFDWLITSLK